MKEKVENIYEEREDEINNFDSNSKKTNKELCLYKSVENNPIGRLDKDSISNGNINSMRNMSILKFMIDDKFFINSNIEYDNLSIFRGKILKPSIEYSNKSEDSKNPDINMNGNNIIVNSNSHRYKKNSNNINTNRMNSEEIKENSNTNLKEVNKVDNFNIKNMKINSNVKYFQESSVNEPLVF